MLDFQAARYLMKGEVAGQEGNSHPTAPGTGMFQTADGYINIAASGDSVWERFCEVGRRDGPAHQSRFRHACRRAPRTAPALRERIADIMRSNTSDHWVEALNKAGVPCGPINTIDKVFADPQVQHLGIATPVDHPKYGPQTVVGQPIHLSRYPQPEKLQPTPDHGEHTDEDPGGPGLQGGDIAALRAKGAV